MLKVDKNLSKKLEVRNDEASKAMNHNTSIELVEA